MRKILKDFKPDIVIGTGGYVTGTVLGQAAAMKLPSETHKALTDDFRRYFKHLPEIMMI